MAIDLSKINWATILENALVIIITAFVIWVAKFIFDKRKNIYRFFKKQKLRFFPINFNIALSLDFNDGLNSGNYFEEIKRKLTKNIGDTDLSKNIKICDFSDIQRFSDKEEAEDFRNRKNIDLIIWGGFSSDELQINGEKISKLDLKFTYGYPDDEGKNIGKMILLDISSKLAKRNYWQILENNSYKDVEIVSDNIFDISTYILALILKLYGKISESVNLFEKLRDRLDGEDLLKKEIEPHLLNCYALLITDLAINKKNYFLGIELCNKFLQILPFSHFAISNLAIFQYKTGLKDKAIENVNLLLERYPNNSITEVDVAFVRILQKNYSNAYKHYSKLSRFEFIEFNPHEVVDFLDSEYKLLKEPALLYGSGLISYKWGDLVIAKEDLGLFMEKTQGLDCYKKMYRESRRILNNIDL